MSNTHSNDALTLVIRLAGEMDHTHGPETAEVLARWRPALNAMMAGKTREEAIAALRPEPKYPCPLTRHDLNDALDQAECSVHDQIKYDGEREYVMDGLRKVRKLVQQALDAQAVALPIRCDVCTKALTQGNVDACGSPVCPYKNRRSP